jgi:hypothetical protein
MRIDKWLTLSANVAVLIGILFLAVEIQQSNRIATAASELDIRDQFRELNVVILDNPEIAGLLVKAGNADAEFSDLEEEQAYAFLYAFLNTWTSIGHAHRNGLVADSTMDIAISDIQALARDYPGFRPLLQNMLEVIPKTQGEARVLDAMEKAVDSP